MENKVFVKINLPSPPYAHLRHHAEKKLISISIALPLPIFQTRMERAEVTTYLLFIALFLYAAGQGCIPEMILKSCSILSRLNLQLENCVAN